VLFTKWYYESRRMSWGGPVSDVEEKRNAYKVLIRNPEWKKDH
jgi:hypothetical protein